MVLNFMAVGVELRGIYDASQFYFLEKRTWGSDSLKERKRGGVLKWWLGFYGQRAGQSGSQFTSSLHRLLLLATSSAYEV